MDKHRSRSPQNSTKDSGKARRRSRSPRRHRLDHKPNAATLPLDASPLSRHDLATYRSMFALYLDIQKQIDLVDLPEDEVKGRWKSFVGKWNRGELAEGWYDPETLEKVLSAEGTAPTPRRPSPEYRAREKGSGVADEEDDGDDYGPSLPSNMANTQLHSHGSFNRKAGPAIPQTQDLLHRRELLDEEAITTRQNEREDLQSARRVDRKLQQSRLDELVPKAEAGTRERQLEKKREKADANRSFAVAKEVGGDVELKDADVMGDEDSLAELKRMKQAEQRKKNEREIRREEVLRARQAEREERLSGMRAKEEKTMEMLREIARVRFGGGEN